MPKPPDWKWKDKPGYVRSYDAPSKADLHKRGDALYIYIDELTFDQLAEISELFGTKKINIGSETRNGGYCETCEYSYSVAVLDVMDVTRWP